MFNRIADIPILMPEHPAAKKQKRVPYTRKDALKNAYKAKVATMKNKGKRYG